MTASASRGRSVGGCRLAARSIALGAWARLGPLPHDLLAAQDDVSTVVVDRHGVPLYEARSDRGARAARLEAASLPPALVHATIAAEDRRFRRHPGIDPVAVVRAAVRNVRAGQVVEGASTITQQVAKLLLGGGAAPRSRSVLAKVEEALVIALRLESPAQQGRDPCALPESCPVRESGDRRRACQRGLLPGRRRHS